MAARFQRVIAMDLSAAQIAHAPPLPNVELRVAHAEDSGIGAASVSLITVAQALHWFDLRRFWQEARRVLIPRGVVAVWSYGVFVIDPPEIAAICQHFYEDIVGPFCPPGETYRGGWLRSARLSLR
jgi:ubiquinone/menaquinone biosynthesis C-methylase UbiE